MTLSIDDRRILAAVSETPAGGPLPFPSHDLDRLARHGFIVPLLESDRWRLTNRGEAELRTAPASGASIDTIHSGGENMGDPRPRGLGDHETKENVPPSPRERLACRAEQLQQRGAANRQKAGIETEIGFIIGDLLKWLPPAFYTEAPGAALGLAAHFETLL
jgi:hypothetical protein